MYWYNHQHINKVILLGKIMRACVCVCVGVVVTGIGGPERSVLSLACIVVLGGE